ALPTNDRIDSGVPPRRIETHLGALRPAVVGRYSGPNAVEPDRPGAAGALEAHFQVWPLPLEPRRRREGDRFAECLKKALVAVLAAEDCPTLFGDLQDEPPPGVRRRFRQSEVDLGLARRVDVQ